MILKPLATALIAALFFPSAIHAEESRIIAVVNDEVITQTELNQAVAPVYLQFQAAYGPEELARKIQEVRNQVLHQLIEERLMLQEARSPRPVEFAKGKVGTPNPIAVSDSEVEEMVTQAKARFSDPEEFEQALQEQGVTLESLKERFRTEITLQKLINREIRSKVMVSPAEVTAYYESHRGEFEAPPAVQVAMILIKPKDPSDASRAQAKAKDLRQQLEQGADFYDLAMRYSDGPNAAQGGRMGFLEKGKSLKEIDQTLFTLKVGEISPVIKTSLGFHLFRVEAIRPVHQAALEEVQDRIRLRLFQEKGAQRYLEWIAKLKENSYISVKAVNE